MMNNQPLVAEEKVVEEKVPQHRGHVSRCVKEHSSWKKS